jgi:hypothetical protein
MAPNYGPKIPKNELSLLFDPGNSKSYPGTGSTIFDLSGNGNHGVLGGAPTFTSGYISYDGTDDQITVTSNQDSLNFANEQTIIIWMYHTFTSGRRNPYDQAYGGYGTWTHEQGININYYYGNAGTNNVPYTSRTSTTTPTSLWQMMSITRSNTTVNWYRNGVLSNTAANAYGVTLTTTNANIQFGNGYAGRWIGNMGPMLLYKRDINAGEMMQIYSAYKGRYGL